MANGACEEPAEAGALGLVCRYTTAEGTDICDCQRGTRQRDGGRSYTWQCQTIRMRDGGGFTFDAGRRRDGG
jgi:hypothetical protein